MPDDAMMPNSGHARCETSLRVLEMATQFGVGGIARHVLDLRDWLALRGHRVALAGSADAWAGPETIPGFLDLPTKHVAGQGASTASRLAALGRAAARLRSHLKDYPVDLIHAHESAPGLVAQLARAGRSIPLVVTYHGSEPERIVPFARIARRADLVVTPSRRAADDLIRLGGVPEGRLKVIGLGIRPPPADTAEEVARLRAELLGDGERLIVTIARLSHQKGIDILIDCIDRIRRHQRGLRFVVAGDGPDRDMLEDLARRRGLEDALQFVGRADRPHLYLRAADLFLLTSRWEALPITIVEAFQTGTPVVATACSGVVELVDDSVGAIVPIGDREAICDAITRILTSEAPSLAGRAAAALARSHEDRFRPDWVHQQFEETYRVLVYRHGWPR